MSIASKNEIVIHVSPQFIKRMPDPHDQRRWNYVGTIPALEAIKLLRGSANPRESNLASKVSGMIRDTIQNSPKEFHLMNRGLIVSAVDATLDTEAKRLIIQNPSNAEGTLWGILDGGHTHDVLKEAAQSAVGADGAVELASLKDVWVDVKIRLGLAKDEVIDAAEANNTSAQLRPWTLANFRGDLAPLKALIDKEMPDLSTEIAFKENQTNPETGQLCEWDVLNLLQRMTLLNIWRYPGYDPSKHPVESYSSKAKVLEKFVESPEKYLHMSGLIGDAFRMPAILEAKLSQLPKIHGRLAFLTKAKSGEVDASLRGKHALVRKYRVSDAVLFPMVAALRPLIEEHGSKLRWMVDPIEFLDENLEALYQAFLQFYNGEVEEKNRKGSLSGMGKDARLWSVLHAKVLAILAQAGRR